MAGAGAAIKTGHKKLSLGDWSVRGMHARMRPGILSKNVSVRAALQARLSCPVWPYRWPCTRAARLVSTCATRPGDDGASDDGGMDALPDALPASFADTDWREFRARLIAITRGDEGPTVSVQEGAWAHELPGPEKGALLLAHPQMFRDSQTYFAFAAILLLDHDDAEGSYGVILNRPTEYTLEQLQGIPPLEAFPGNRLFLGGDVGETAMVVLTHRGDVASAQQVLKGVFLCNIAAAEQAVRSGHAAATDFRFFAKYSGWGPGQLIRECRAGVWFCAAAGPSLVLAEEASGRQLWHKVLDSMGGDYAKVSEAVRKAFMGAEDAGRAQQQEEQRQQRRTPGEA